MNVIILLGIIEKKKKKKKKNHCEVVTTHTHCFPGSQLDMSKFQSSETSLFIVLFAWI